MDFFKSIKLAAAAMTAQSGRMRVIAENIANSDSTADKAGGDPYRRKIPVFKNELDREMGFNRVNLEKIIHDKSPFGKKLDPGHPAADADGYIKTSNVDGLVEMVDMREAQRSYEANLNVIKSTRTMIGQTLELLRR